MTERLGLDSVALHPQSPRLTLSLGRGQSLAIVGPACAGKSHLLRALADQEKVPYGDVSRTGELVLARPGGLSRRARVQAITQRAPGTGDLRVNDALVQLRLAEVLHESIGGLVDAQMAAAEILEAAVSGADVMLLDGQVDRLDVSALAGFRRCLGTLTGSGVSVVVTTQRPDIAALMDSLVVLQSQMLRFAGSVADLIRQGAQHRVEVHTDQKPAVRALVEPFSIRVEETAEGFVFAAEEGQALAAKLLLAGYGDVRMVIVRPPSVEEALLRVLA